MLKQKFILSLGGALVLSAVLAGCNPVASVQKKAGEQLAEKMIEKSTGEKVDINQDGKSVTVTTKDGTYKSGQQTLEEVKKYIDLPEWMIADETSGVAVSNSTAEKQLSIYGSVHSTKSLAETKTYWTNYFATQNYENITKTDANGTLLLSGNKDSGNTNLTVTVSADEQGKVSVALAFSKKTE